MSSTDLVFDPWTPLGYKRALGPGPGVRTGGRSWIAPTWVGDHARRLQAYKILQAYFDNAARHFLEVDNESDREDRREYGDAAMLVESILDALIGDEQMITVEGADAFDPELPDDADPTERERNTEAERASEREELLHQWAIDEQFALKLIEAEGDAGRLGDGVWTVAWSAAKRRPRIRVYEPGFYFPVLAEGEEDDFPRKVHLAWEIEEGSKQLVRRITWELGPIVPPLDDLGFRLEDENGNFVVREGDIQLADGRWARRYPWNPETDAKGKAIEPSTVTCYMTDATWELNDQSQKVEDFTGARASYRMNDDGQVVNRLDLMIDFIPVVHVPNTPAGQQHYGTSDLMRIVQALDDLGGGDTDLQKSSVTAGTPGYALEGGSLPRERSTSEGSFFGADNGSRGELEWGPGHIMETGEGKLKVLDTANALKALLEYKDALLERISVNGRVPESWLGRVKPSEVPSGIALALSFRPLQSLIAKKRLVRAQKYPLLLKLVQRLFMLGGYIEPGFDNMLNANVSFGAFMPADKVAAVDAVTKLLEKKAISKRTALHILVDAGFPIDDAAEEMRRIEQEDFEGAEAMLAATGNEQAVGDRLGVEPARLPAPPPE